MPPQNKIQEENQHSNQAELLKTGGNAEQSARLPLIQEAEGDQNNRMLEFSDLIQKKRTNIGIGALEKIDEESYPLRNNNTKKHQSTKTLNNISRHPYRTPMVQMSENNLLKSDFESV